MVVEVIVIGDCLPQLAVRIVEVDPHPVPQFLVDVHYAAGIAITGSLATNAMDIIDHHWTDHPFAPRGLGPGKRHVVTTREFRAVRTKIGQGYDLAITQIIPGVDGCAAVEALAVGVVI